jgi:hypothetical protein
MLVVGLGEREVSPDGEARGARCLLDVESIEEYGEGAAGGGEVGDAKSDVVEHGFVSARGSRSRSG